MKGIAGALLVAAIVAVVAVAVIMLTKEFYTPTQDMSDGFVDTAPTRASECRCLPGYVPSILEEGGTHYVCQKLGEPTVTLKCY